MSYAWSKIDFSHRLLLAKFATVVPDYIESKLLVFFVFSVCSHVYLLNYRSELAQDTDTIHDHNHTKKKISMQVRLAIMGRNGRVVLGA